MPERAELLSRAFLFVLKLTPPPHRGLDHSLREGVHGLAVLQPNRVPRSGDRVRSTGAGGIKKTHRFRKTGVLNLRSVCFFGYIQGCTGIEGEIVVESIKSTCGGDLVICLSCDHCSVVTAK